MVEDIEKALLGSIISSPNELWNIDLPLMPKMFKSTQNGQIMRLIQDAAKNDEPYDMVGLVAKAKRVGLIENIGGPAYITELASAFQPTAQTLHLALLVYEDYMRRSIVSKCKNMLAAYNTGTLNDPFKMAEKMLVEIEELDPSVKISKLHDSKTVAKAHMEETMERQKNKDEPRWTTGIHSLDPHFQFSKEEGELVILGGAPGHGKTATITQMAKHMSMEHKVPSVIFSLEMSERKITNRILSNITGIPYKAIEHGRMNEEQWKLYMDCLDKFEQAPLWIDASSTQTLFSIKSTLRKLKAKGVKIAFLDYFQLLKSDGRHSKKLEAYQEMSSTLRVLAKDFGITIVICSQLNRESLKAAPKEPGERIHFGSWALKETSQLEQDAHFIAICNMPQKYNDHWEKETLIIDIPKNREGVASYAEASLDGATQKISEKEGEESHVF